MQKIYSKLLQWIEKSNKFMCCNFLLFVLHIRCVPSGGSEFKKDDIGRRNGHAPNSKMAEVLTKTIAEAKANISKVRSYFHGNFKFTEIG